MLFSMISMATEDEFDIDATELRCAEASRDLLAIPIYQETIIESLHKQTNDTSICSEKG